MAVLAVLVGCGPEPRPRSTEEMIEFGPASMRLHPIFTRMVDTTGDGKADGVLALLELSDSYGDPTKAMGRVLLELYDYRPLEADPRGVRVGGPWVFALNTRPLQLEHWNRITGAYEFRLKLETFNPGKTYVLTAQFDHAGHDRFFSQVVIEPPPSEPKVATSQPTTRPQP